MQMFERLQKLPLLMGLGKPELMTILEHIDIAFCKHTEGTVLASQGERCDRVTYVLSGIVSAEQYVSLQQSLAPAAPSFGHFRLTEELGTMPLLIEPQNLWGMRPVFSRTYTMQSEGSSCSISKYHMAWLIANYELVRANILNFVCNQLQSMRPQSRVCIAPDAAGRIVSFLCRNVLTAEGRKELYIKMDTLAQMVAEPRMHVSRAINEWCRQGLVQTSRGRLLIPDFERLLIYNQQHIIQ